MGQKKHNLTPGQAARIGAYLKGLRRRADMSLHELDQASGVAYGYISKLENGHFRQPGEALSRLAKALGTTYEDILSCGTSGPGALYDGEVVRLVIEGEATMSFIPRSDLDCADTSVLKAVRITDQPLPSGRIAPGDVIVIDSRSPFIDDKLYVICYKGQWAIRYLRREEDCYILMGDGLDVRVPQDDVVIAGRIIYVDKGFPV